MAGNKHGFTKDNAREMQALAVKSRMKNQRRRMRKALSMAAAETDEWTAVEKMFLAIANEALSGNVKAARFVFEVLTKGEN